jgi:hypothetical protein
MSNFNQKEIRKRFENGQYEELHFYNNVEYPKQNYLKGREAAELLVEQSVESGSYAEIYGIGNGNSTIVHIYE